MRKKIVITSNSSFSVYNFRVGLIRSLRERGYEIVVLAPKDDYTPLLEEESLFVPVHNLDRKGKNPLKDLRLLYELYSIYRKLKPDLVINYTIKPNIYSSIACGLLTIPSVSVVTGLGHVFIEKSILSNLVAFLYRIAFFFNSYVFLLNEDDAKVIQRITSSSKLVLLRGEGINTSYFFPGFCKESVNKKFTFLFVGRFLKEKGIFELIEAGKELYKSRKDFEVCLLGDLDHGNPSSLSKEDVKSISTLEFVRIIPFSKDVRPYICSSDCVILPSYREGIPRSLLEAMAMGKPIITTDAPGCREVCKDGVNGIMVKQRDVEHLCKAMEMMMDMSLEYRKAMGLKGRSMVEEYYDEKKVIDEYLKVVERVLWST